jgi:hypothetical protein
MASHIRCPICGQWKISLSKHFAWSSSCGEAFLIGHSLEDSILKESSSTISNTHYDCSEDDTSSCFGNHYLPVLPSEEGDISVTEEGNPWSAEELEEDAFGNFQSVQVQSSAGAVQFYQQHEEDFTPCGSNIELTNVEESVQIDLLKLLKDMRAPLYAYDTMMQWAANATSLGYTFHHNSRGQDCILSDLIKRYNMQGIQPRLVPVV